MAEAINIASDAGKAIMNIYAQTNARGPADLGFLSAHKADGSPLTLADMAAHNLIGRRLGILTPDVPVVSEEDESSLADRQAKRTFWLIDPLDGTKEFLSRNGEFTVNMALISNGEVVFGVVVAPALGLAYWGGRGLGAYRKAEGCPVDAIKVARTVAADRPIRVVASKSHLDAKTLQFIEQLGPHELVRTGSSLKFCLIAEGTADIYPRLGPTCEWDTAAAQAVVEAAGGHVVALDGSPLYYGKPDIYNPYFVASSVPLSDILSRP